MSDELKFHEQFITLVDEELSLFIFFSSIHSTRDVLFVQSTVLATRVVVLVGTPIPVGNFCVLCCESPGF